MVVVAKSRREHSRVISDGNIDQRSPALKKSLPCAYLRDFHGGGGLLLEELESFARFADVAPGQESILGIKLFGRSKARGGPKQRQSLIIFSSVVMKQAGLVQDVGVGLALF